VNPVFSRSLPGFPARQVPRSPRMACLSRGVFGFLMRSGAKDVGRWKRSGGREHPFRPWRCTHFLKHRQTRQEGLGVGCGRFLLHPGSAVIRQEAALPVRVGPFGALGVMAQTDHLAKPDEDGVRPSPHGIGTDRCAKHRPLAEPATAWCPPVCPPRPETGPASARRCGRRAHARTAGSPSPSTPGRAGD
jgi:hypothetical protein